MSTFSVQSGDNQLPIDILNKIADPSLSHLIGNLLSGFRQIGNTLREASFSSDKVGTANDFGDEQLDVDVKTDTILFNVLKASQNVHVASSEENPTEISCAPSSSSSSSFSSSSSSSSLLSETSDSNLGYSVAFDPLDGSSIFDANFSVGTILGIWPGTTLLNRLGEEQSASVIAIYGPMVTLALAINSHASKDGKAHCIQLNMHPTGWEYCKNFIISPEAKTFAPGNLRATADNVDYMALVQYYIEKKYTLRYSGGLVPDIYHILVKGQGVLTNASSPKAKAKLRLLYECAPIALIIHAAGGDSCVCGTEIDEQLDPVSILKIPTTTLDRRIGVCYGSSQEVDRFRKYIFTKKGKENTTP